MMVLMMFMIFMMLMRFMVIPVMTLTVRIIIIMPTVTVMMNPVIKMMIMRRAGTQTYFNQDTVPSITAVTLVIVTHIVHLPA